MSLVRLGKLHKSKMVSSIEKIAKEVVNLSEGNYQTALLYSAIAGAIVSDVVATPASTWAYYKMRKYQEQEKSGLITSKEAEKKIGQAYYLATPIWWGLVFALVHFKKGGFNEKAKLALVVVSGGAIIGSIYKQYIKNLPKIDI